MLRGYVVLSVFFCNVLMKFARKTMLLAVFLNVFIASMSSGQINAKERRPQEIRYHDTEKSHLQYPNDRSSDEKKKAVFGPKNNKECPFNYEFTNPRNIKQTQSVIEMCTADYISCNSARNQKYRTINGSCNNLKHPSWGRSNNCLRRILPYDYGDKISYPRKSCKGKELPNPRLISDVFHRELKPHPDPFTTHLMEWGQLIGHDVSLNDIFRTKESDYHFPPDCCKNGPTVSDECLTFEVPPTDSFYPQYGVTCVGNARTTPCPLCKGGQKQQWNQNTAYLDASLLYGSTDERAQELRSGINGMMIVESNPLSGPTLPTVAIEELCVSPPNQKSCYRAGDNRSNQNLFMLTIHTMLLRNHNNICQELHDLNPHWDDERLYQETRRILIAQIQKITYTDYLPIILGELADKMGFLVQQGARYTEYDPDLDAGIVDEFTNVAQRYGHTHVPPTFTEVDPETGEQTTQLLRNTFYTPFGFRYGQFDKICGGMTRDMKMKHDIFVNGDLRNYLYRRVYMNETTGNDLTAGAILRGRDHGVPGYTAYLKYLRNITVTSFEDLNHLIPDKNIHQLQDLYESVHDVDLYTGALAECHVFEGLVGETFGIILADQHNRMKYGDRYWFEHKNQAGSFIEEQLLEIKRTTLSRIICETTKIKEVQAEVFLLPSYSNPPIPCEKIHRFNFTSWKE